MICAVHSACVGGGVDLACAADIRLASSDAWFSIKEASFAKGGGGGGGVARTIARSRWAESSTGSARVKCMQRRSRRCSAAISSNSLTLARRSGSFYRDDLPGRHRAVRRPRHVAAATETYRERVAGQRVGLHGEEVSTVFAGPVVSDFKKNGYCCVCTFPMPSVSMYMRVCCPALSTIIALHLFRPPYAPYTVKFPPNGYYCDHT